MHKPIITLANAEINSWSILFNLCQGAKLNWLVDAIVLIDLITF